ncbi:MAG: aryl-sulfate sulfotransferase [Rhodobacteraceae bacterium]|nr:aryl-sulfate sulfotransferase [Paracoccaceae bacterium]
MFARIASIVGGLFLLTLGTFLAGMWTTYRDWWPWQKVVEVQTAWRSYRVTGLFLPQDSFPRRRPDAADERYAVYDPAKVSPGYLVINRLDPQTNTYVLDLIDEKGTLINSRPLDFSRASPIGTAQEFVHIATMMPDGSVITVHDDAKGLVRYDACGNPMWSKTDQVYHHSLELDVDGMWTWQSKIWDGGEDQRMIRFDPDTGEILESIDLIDDVILKSQENAVKMIIPEEYQFNREMAVGGAEDIMHPNDVEPLRASMAAAFPQFSVGDLLVSFRNTNMVAVIDRKTHDILWQQYGPWFRQHDPDFQADGTITVFSNNTYRFRSNIYQVDPKTGQGHDIFREKDIDFDSFIMGKHQKLPNGNWLIVSTMQGRILEVTPDGEIVREYNNILDDTYNSLVLYAEHLAPGYLKTIPKCGN